jgi:predicted RNase H-like HicB family nuclease
MNDMNYLVVIEKGPKSFGAYVPDLPGVGVAGRTVSEVKRLVKEAIRLHIAGLREEGLPIPPPMARPHEVPAPRVRGHRSVSAQSVGRYRRTSAAR